MAEQHIHFRPLGSGDAGVIRRMQHRLFPPHLRETEAEIRGILENTEEHMVCNYSFGVYDDTRIVGYLFAYVESRSIVYDRDEEVVYLKEIALLPGYEGSLRQLFVRLFRQWVAFSPGIAFEAHAEPGSYDQWQRMRRLFRRYGLTMAETRAVSDADSGVEYKLIRLDAAADTVAVAERRHRISAERWPHRDKVTVEVITDANEWLSLRDAWPQLLTATPDSNVLQSFDYLWQWWKYYGTWRDLRVFAIRDGGELIGVAPLMVEHFPVFGRTMRNLRFLTARMDMSRPKLLFGRHPERCLDAFFAWLDAHPGAWDVLDLDEQLPDEAVHDAIARQATQPPLWAVDQTVCPYITLQGTWDQFLATRSSRMRSNVRRIRRRIEEAGSVHVDCATEPAAVEAAMNTFVDIESESWKAEEGIHLEANRSRYYFNRSLAQVFSASGQFQIRTLHVDGKPVASTYGIAFDGVFQSLKIAHDDRYSRYSPGTLLESFEIEDMFSRSMNRYEFLGSFVTNKLRWTDEVVQTTNVHLFRRRPRMMLFYLFYFVLRTRVKDWLKRAGWFNRVHRAMLKMNFDPFPRYD